MVLVSAGDVGESEALTPPIRITHYTDPLCVWSWAFEPVWRQLLDARADTVTWRYRMGGMIADWSRYGDPLNNVSAAAQMGPHWLHVARQTGATVDSRLWHDDPPQSSHPACVAVKAAEGQGRDAGERYLARLRRAVMTERRNIARDEVLTAVAVEAALDLDAFTTALDDGSAVEAFRDDLRDSRYREIGRFPTLLLERDGRRGLLITGYRPLEVLLAAVDELAAAVGAVVAEGDVSAPA